MELSRIFLLIPAVLLLLAGFASAAGPGAEDVVITKEHNGKQIVVPEGAIIEVRLEQHAGTGYMWQIVDLDETHLRVLESTETPLRQGPIMGGPLLKVWKMKAVKAGQTDLRLLLYRPWEGPQKAAERFQVKIQIR